MSSSISLGTLSDNLDLLSKIGFQTYLCVDMKTKKLGTARTWWWSGYPSDVFKVVEETFEKAIQHLHDEKIQSNYHESYNNLLFKIKKTYSFDEDATKIIQAILGRFDRNGHDKKIGEGFSLRMRSMYVGKLESREEKLERQWTELRWNVANFKKIQQQQHELVPEFQKLCDEGKNTIPKSAPINADELKNAIMGLNSVIRKVEEFDQDPVVARKKVAYLPTLEELETGKGTLKTVEPLPKPEVPDKFAEMIKSQKEQLKKTDKLEALIKQDQPEQILPCIDPEEQKIFVLSPKQREPYHLEEEQFSSDPKGDYLSMLYSLREKMENFEFSESEEESYHLEELNEIFDPLTESETEEAEELAEQPYDPAVSDPKVLKERQETINCMLMMSPLFNRRGETSES